MLILELSQLQWIQALLLETVLFRERRKTVSSLRQMCPEQETPTPVLCYAHGDNLVYSVLHIGRGWATQLTQAQLGQMLITTLREGGLLNKMGGSR